jgi:hypothetical protein
MKVVISKLLSFFGLQTRKIRALPFFPRYVRESFIFMSRGGKITKFFPILEDYVDQAGEASGHYFHQDLLVASMVHDSAPRVHLDVGSRVDGFVAHVASFRKIRVIDVRPLAESGHPNLEFQQMDVMGKEIVGGQADSISCLHALEHFGLGRYGDTLDPLGHLIGFNNLVKMLKPGGVLYVSFPISSNSEVHFNAHRVFQPREILTWSTGDHRLDLVRFDFVDDSGGLHTNVNIETFDSYLAYGCGIYTFRKLAS